MQPFAIYHIGLVPLGLSYAWLKENVSGVVLLVGAVGYLAVLRWLALLYGKKN